MATEEQIAQVMKENNSTGPRVTPPHVDSVITGWTFTRLPSRRVIICEMSLKNGFVVLGESIVYSKENFVETLGENIAYENARAKVFELEAYLMREKSYEP